jgi:lysophospholipase L1-like esterase
VRTRSLLPALCLFGAACSSGRPAAVGVDAGAEAGLDAPAETAGLDAPAETAGPVDDPTFASFWSGTALAVPAQQAFASTGAYVNTYRSYAKPRVAGAYNWRFWVGNTTDSTYGSGPLAPNQPGGSWRIEAASVGDGGPTPGGALVAGTERAVTFGGAASRDVAPGERFWSDPVALDLPAGHLLAFTWAVSGAAAGPAIPYAHSSFTTSYYNGSSNVAAEEAATDFFASHDRLVAPHLFAYDRPVTERLCFLGDSITQGVGSSTDSYAFWVAKIADGLSPDVGIWNLGSGWARAADAASDGAWLYKAKQCTEVAVILGVNDIGSEHVSADQLLGYLTTIVSLLKQHNSAARVILFTVPTFNFTGAAYTTWRAVNNTILASPPAGVERVFDVAAVLSQPAPNDGLVQTGYANGSDGHPNDAGSAAIAAAFLAWYAPAPDAAMP